MYQMMIQQCLTHGIVAGSRSQITASRLISSMVGKHFAISLSANQNNPIVSVSSQVNYGPSTIIDRNLWSDASLGMDKLERIREWKNQLFVGPARERYIARLEKFLEGDNIKSFFKDDLINLVGIIENEKELDLLENLIIKIEPDQKELYQGWGTTLMRLYYKLGHLDRAYNNLKDNSRFGLFFNQRACYKIVMTMLFKAGRYEDVVKVYHLADERLIKPNGGHERYLSTVALAALAKVDNPEALAEAEELHEKVDHDDKVSARAIQYLVYLAMNNGKPTYAVNLISQLPVKQHLAMKNLKLLSLIKLERFDDILLQLREYVNFVRRDTYVLLSVTFDLIRDNIEKIQEPGVRKELSDLLTEIKEGGHVSDAKLEELLFKEIDDSQQRFDAGNNMAYNRQGRFDDSGDRQRGFNTRGRQYDRDNSFDQPRNQQARSSGRRFSYQNMDLSS